MFVGTVGSVGGITVSASAKLAETNLAASMVIMQAPAPAQAPLQLLNVESVPAVAVRMTGVPLLKASVQSIPHVMPDGTLVTVPDPMPVTATVRKEMGIPALNKPWTCVSIARALVRCAP